MLPQNGESLELKSTKKIERDKKKEKVYKFVFIIFHHHHNMKKVYISALIMKSKESN